MVDRSPSSAVMLGGGFALIAVLLGVAWFVLRPKEPGTLQFATDPPDVVVVFDGQAVQASSSPFSISVEPDEPHLLEVNKVGFRTYSTQVTLRPGEARTLPTIALQSQGGNPAARNVQVSFASDPTGADVVLVRGRDRAVLGRTPVNAAVDVAGEPWTVEMTLDGYETWRGGLSVPEGHSTMALSATLRARGQGTTETPAVRPTTTTQNTPPATTAQVAMTTATATPPATQSNPTPMTEPAASMTTATESSGTGPGVLRINTTPWSQVFVDGRLIGNTPQMNIQLPAGMHRITLVNPDFNIRENQSVMIEPGQTVTRVIRLTAPAAPTPTP